MNCADAIYRRSLSLPDPAAREALDFIDFLAGDTARRRDRPIGSLQNETRRR
ncbi:MAG: hypothetical protein IPG57_07355 [Burkholderiales bacterium]|nr:hypothetical protein [Burkholderiales bacterium]